MSNSRDVPLPDARRLGHARVHAAALQQVRKALSAEASVLDRAISDQASSSIEAKLARKGSYQLGGVASCVATAKQRHLPRGFGPGGAGGASADGKPSPPPSSDNLSTLRGCFLARLAIQRREEARFWKGQLVAAIAKASRVSGYARLSDFKGLAVLQMMPPPPTDLALSSRPSTAGGVSRPGTASSTRGFSRPGSAAAPPAIISRSVTIGVPKVEKLALHPGPHRAATSGKLLQAGGEHEGGSSASTSAVSSKKPSRQPSARIRDELLNPAGSNEDEKLRIAAEEASKRQPVEIVDRWATPQRVLEAAHELGILYGMIGSIQGLGGPPPGLTTRAAPYRALWVACEFAVAPLPALWKARWQRGETADHPLRVVYEKTEQGHVTERDEHPLLHAYQSIAARFIPHCPRASIKTSPQCAYMLFSVDGMPLHRHAPRRQALLQAAQDRRVRQQQWHGRSDARRRTAPWGFHLQAQLGR